LLFVAFCKCATRDDGQAVSPSLGHPFDFAFAIVDLETARRSHTGVVLLLISEALHFMVLHFGRIELAKVSGFAYGMLGALLRRNLVPTFIDDPGRVASTAFDALMLTTTDFFCRDGGYDRRFIADLLKAASTPADIAAALAGAPACRQVVFETGRTAPMAPGAI
jgi:hypothetical protein